MLLVLLNYNISYCVLLSSIIFQLEGRSVSTWSRRLSLFISHLPWQHSNMLGSQICLALSPESSCWHAFQRSRLETIEYKITGNSCISPKIMYHYQDSGLAYVSIFANGTNSPPAFCVGIHR